MIICDWCGKKLERRCFCSDKCRVRWRRRNGGNVSPLMRVEILNRDNYKCKNCGATEKLEIDHIFPISKGGKTEILNLQVLCHKCNGKKSNKT